MKITSTKFEYDDGVIFRDQIAAVFLDESCKDRRFKIVLKHGIVITMPLYMSLHFNYSTKCFINYLGI